MKDNIEVKLVRLKTGEDIICFCYEDYKNKRVFIQNPKVFFFDFDDDGEQHLIFANWLQKEAYAHQHVFISTDEVLFTALSNVGFGVQYLQLISDEIDNTSELYKLIKQTLDEYEAKLDDTEEKPLSKPKGTTLH